MSTKPRCLRCLDHPGWASADPLARHSVDDVCRQCLGSGFDQKCEPVPAEFWAQIDHQLRRIATEKPTSFDVVRAILLDPAYGAIRADVDLNGTRSFDNDTAFFAGSGGDATLYAALRSAGWRPRGHRASYFYSMFNEHTGEILTYTEGDVERGDLLGGTSHEVGPA